MKGIRPLRRFSAWFTAGLASSLSLATPEAAEPVEDRPNIVVIMADDMGFSDIGSYGGEIRTPHLDRLASGGLRFSRFYNCALCGPSRAALMTGLQPHDAGITGWTGLLSGRSVTVFELLKQAGYATCAVGRLDMVTAENWHDPEKIGRHVDRFFGTTGHKGPGNYFKDVHHTDFYRDGEPYSIPEGGYKTDLITDFAAAFIRESSRDKPFFLYLSHYAPHWPLHAKPVDIAKYRSTYRELGWDRAREKRMERLIGLGIMPPGTRAAPRDARAAPWEESKSQDWEAERMAVYAAQIDCLDQGVGRVMAALDEVGADENTLVLFLSDNGAAETAVGTLDKPGRTWRSDGVATRSGNRPEVMPGPADTFQTAGPAWSSLSNTPFREHKRTAYEGGIASPLIAWWPEGIKERGKWTRELTHITDLPATILDLAGVEYPDRFEDRIVLPPAGKSLLPLFREGARDGHEALFWSISGHRAVRDEGDWKLVSPKSAPWELYDLSNDPTELTDLAASEPDRVRQMESLFLEWQNRPSAP